MTFRASSLLSNVMVLTLATASLVGCGGKAKEKELPVGRAVLGVAVSALDQSNIATVRVTVHYALGGLPDIVADLVPTGPVVPAGTDWTGVIGEIPAGQELFTVDALAADGMTVLYSNSMAPDMVLIQDGVTASVIITVQQVNGTSTFSDTAPVITSIDASSNAVGPGDVVNLTVTASGTGIAYAWTDDCGGSFAPNNAAVTAWTAPAMSAICNLTIKVTDATGAFAAITVAITVAAQDATGSASLVITFNTWPVVNSITDSADPIDVSQTTQVTANATDSDGDVLTFAWTDNGCGGSFNNAGIFNPVYTAPGSYPAGNTCTLTVTVDDGRGGSNTGSLTIQVATPIGTDEAPQFTMTFQDIGGDVSLPAGIGLTVNFSVTAMDPQAGMLTWQWSFLPADATATLGTPGNGEVDTATTSTNTFVVGSNQSTYTVTVTATDPLNLSTSYTFTVYGAG